MATRHFSCSKKQTSFLSWFLILFTLVGRHEIPASATTYFVTRARRSLFWWVGNDNVSYHHWGEMRWYVTFHNQQDCVYGFPSVLLATRATADVSELFLIPESQVACHEWQIGKVIWIWKEFICLSRFWFLSRFCLKAEGRHYLDLLSTWTREIANFQYSHLITQKWSQFVHLNIKKILPRGQP